DRRRQVPRRSDRDRNARLELPGFVRSHSPFSLPRLRGRVRVTTLLPPRLLSNSLPRSRNISPSPSGGGSGPAGPREPRFSAMRAFEALGWGLSGWGPTGPAG